MTSDMTEQERYDKLKNQNAIAEAEAMYGTDIRDGVRLKSNDRKKLFQKIASIFGITRDYRNQDVELEFGFSNENLSESLNKQKRYYYSYLKMLSCFENVVDSAIGIETHNRNEAGYKVDPTLENMYVLVSAFQDGENITPVKLEIKEFSDKPNTLYVAIALDSIQKGKLSNKNSGIVTEGNTVSGVTQSAPPLIVSLADLFTNVNPQDSSFLKYVPTQFLTEQQRAGEKYSSRTASDSEYLNLAQNPEENREALSRMVEQAADAVLNYNLQDGQKNNAREGVQFSTRENKNEVAQMREVSSVSAYNGSLKATDIVNKVSEFFESIGGFVNNKELGTISLRRRGIKNDVSHGIGREKAASFMAVPDILQKGKVVDYQTNWKGRGYDTAVIAAPIKIAGVDYLAGVCVKRTSADSNFYVHEVLPIKNEGTMPFNRAALESVDSGGDAPSINSILLDILAVKGNFLKSSRDTSEMTYAEILAEQAALRARQEQVKAKKNEAMNNPELLSAMDSYTEMFSELRNLLW